MAPPPDKIIHSWLVVLLSLFCSFSCVSQNNTREIILINCEECTKDQIAVLIEKVACLRPTVIGVDVELNADASSDTRLLNAMNTDVKLVLPLILYSLGNDDGGSGHESVVTTFSPIYLTKNIRTGFVSVKQKGSDAKTLPLEIVLTKNLHTYEYSHFSLTVAMAFDSAGVAMKMVTLGNRLHDNFANFKSFQTYSFNQVAREDWYADLINKIVFIGYLGPLDIDRYRVPGSPSNSERYGVEYLAHIVDQLLNQ